MLPNIPLEFIQDGGLPLKTMFFTLILRIWKAQRAPADLKNGIITIFKKGDCNYHGIPLLSIAGTSDLYDHFGLTINIQETTVLAQPAPKTVLPNFNITISNTPLEQVNHYPLSPPYLGSLLQVQCNSNKDLENRICAAHLAFGRLSHHIFAKLKTTNQTHGVSSCHHFNLTLWMRNMNPVHLRHQETLVIFH